MTHPPAWQAPLALDDVLAALRARNFARGVVAATPSSPDPALSERILVYAFAGDRLSAMLDAWIEPAGVEPLRIAIGADPGGSDAMYQSAAEYVWALGADDLRLWRREALVGRFSAAECRVRTSPLGSWAAIPTSEIASVHGFLSPAWTERGIRLERSAGRGIGVARKRSFGPLFDPTYDAIDLTCETGWLVELARAIAAAIGIPVSFDADLGPEGSHRLG